MITCVINNNYTTLLDDIKETIDTNDANSAKYARDFHTVKRSQKVEIVFKRTFKLSLVKDLIHQFDIDIGKHYVEYRSGTDFKYTRICYFVPFRSLLTYCYYNNNFDLSKKLSANGLKLVTRLFKNEDLSKKSYYTSLDYRVVLNRYQSEFPTSLETLNNSHVFVHERSFNIEAGESLLDKLAFEDIFLYVIRRYLNELEVKEYCLEFEEPKSLAQAIKIASQEWEDETLMYYYHKLNKLVRSNKVSRPNKISRRDRTTFVASASAEDASSAEAEARLYYVDRLAGNKLDFEQLPKVRISQLTLEDVREFKELYHNYTLGHCDKIKHRKATSRKYLDVITDCSLRRRSSLENLTHDLASKGKFGELTADVLNNRREEYDDEDEDNDDDY